MSRFNIDKDELVFFDDSRSNIREAQEQGFQAIHVRAAEDLQQGITNALRQPVKSPVQNKNNNQPSDLIPYEKLDVKVRQYLSSEMQTERHKLGLSTAEFWQTRSRKEQDEILAKLAAPVVVKQRPNRSPQSQNQSSMFNSFKKLPTNFKAFISDKTQTDRHAIGHMSVAEYWGMLDADEQDNLQEEFAMQQSLAPRNQV